jgi:transposase
MISRGVGAFQREMVGCEQRVHFDGIVAWTQTRQTTGFVEAINGLFQAAKRKARGYTRFQTMRTVLFLIAGKLNFSEINPHTA